jgi:hypothetical protein
MNSVNLGISTEPATAALLERDLPRRYAADYQVMVERSPAAGLDRLRDLRAAGADVALVITDLRMDKYHGIVDQRASSERCTLPIALRGKASTKRTCRGHL